MSKYPAAFISDGYTRTVKIHGEERLYPPCQMTYRPLVGKAYANFFGIAFAGNPDSDSKIGEMLAGQIVSWDLGAPVTPEALERMNSQLFYKILKIVMGTEAPDEDLTDPGNEPQADRDAEEAEAGN